MNAELAMPTGGASVVLTVTQDRVVRELERLIGDGPAGFFRDACVLMALTPPLPTTTHLVAHLLREVESGVRYALEPPGAAKPRNGGHRASVDGVLASLEIADEHKVAAIWRELADQDGSTGFARRAHRRGLDAPRAVDKEFIRFFADVEELFAYIMVRCETHYQLIFDRLDAIARTAAPSRGDVQAFRACAGTLTAQRHFLESAGPQWVGPLTDAGYFRTPPALRLDADGRVELPAWPGSDYLAKMAPAVPTLVVDGALTIPVTDNARVNYDLVRIALAVPAQQAVRLAPAIQASLACRYGVLIPEQVGAVAAHLAAGGHVDPAFGLLSALLATLPGAPGAHGTWEIARIVERDLPALVEAAGVKALAIFCARLDAYLDTEQSWTRKESGSDYSTTWWPDLRHPAPHAEVEAAGALAGGVLAASAQLLRDDPAKTADVFTELEAHGWRLYRRIRLHLLTEIPQVPADLLAEHLLDPGHLHDAGVEGEYLRLARERCTQLSAAERQRVVGLIENGPDLEAWAVKMAGWGPAPTSVQLTQYGDRWKRDRLAAFELVLTSSARALYTVLRAQYGPGAESATAPEQLWGWARAPRSAAELTAMPADKMVALLRDWKPGADAYLGPDTAVMAGVLADVINADRVRWSADARHFCALNAEYVTAVIAALASEREESARFDWDSVLELCEHADEHAVHELGRQSEWTARVWRDARLDIYRLLTQGLDTRSIPDAQLGRVWVLITSGCTDPDPAGQRELDAKDPLSVALGAVRAQAVGCAIAYGWRRREHERDLQAALALLSDHLDPLIDPSLAVRAIYGALLPRLFALAPDWVRAHLVDLLPTSERDRPFWQAAWDAFLRSTNLSGALLDLLRDQYTLALSRIEPASGDEREQARTLRLGIQLLNYYWNGALELEPRDGLLRAFYGRAAPATCRQLAAALAHGLDGARASDPDLLARLRAFWELRENEVSRGADPGELAEFGWWFASGLFDEEWAFGRLLAALATAGDIEAVDAVLERLAALCDRHTVLCLQVVSAWLTTRPRRLYIVRYRRADDIRAVLAAGFRGDETARDAARGLIGQFASMDIDLRDADPRHGANRGPGDS